MRTVQLRRDPQVALVEGLLSTAEASGIIELARLGGADSWRVAASVAREAEANGTVASIPGATEGQVLQERPTKGRHNAWCAVGEDHPLLRMAVRRVTWLCGLTPSHAEHCQVDHYAPGQEYSHHSS